MGHSGDDLCAGTTWSSETTIITEKTRPTLDNFINHNQRLKEKNATQKRKYSRLNCSIESFVIIIFSLLPHARREGEWGHMGPRHRSKILKRVFQMVFFS